MFKDEKVCNSLPQQPLSRTKTLRIAAFDPSLRSTGIGVLEYKDDKFMVIHYETIKNTPTTRISLCLKHIFSSVTDILKKYAPDSASMEAGFFARNAKTALILGHVRAVIILACTLSEIPLYEYPPRSIKIAVTGYGSASKEQVNKMIHTLLKIDSPLTDDIADALAAGLCHINYLTHIHATPKEQL